MKQQGNSLAKLPENGWISLASWWLSHHSAKYVGQIGNPSEVAVKINDLFDVRREGIKKGDQ